MALTGAQRQHNLRQRKGKILDFETDPDMVEDFHYAGGKKFDLTDRAARSVLIKRGLRLLANSMWKNRDALRD